MKEEILRLRETGMSYRDITKTLGCSSATVSYWCSPGGIKRKVASNYGYRATRIHELKLERGGECERCGYSECLGALHFHHTDPSTKDGRLSAKTSSWTKLRQEADKCELICANCHAEEHFEKWHPAQESHLERTVSKTGR